jgi:hypothetical protein
MREPPSEAVRVELRRRVVDPPRDRVRTDHQPTGSLERRRRDGGVAQSRHRNRFEGAALELVPVEREITLRAARVTEEVSA